MWAFPQAMGEAGASGSLIRVPGVPSGGNSTLVYFGCEDCAVEASRVAGAGGRVHQERFSIGQYGFVALVFDTEGNMFGLHSTNQRDAAADPDDPPPVRGQARRVPRRASRRN